nr:Purple acid phosphatase 1 [Ipomoea trifida]
MRLVVVGFWCLILGLILNPTQFCDAGVTSRYVRKSLSALPNAEDVDMPWDSDVFAVPSGYNAPQQVHITQGDYEGRGVIISWTTPYDKAGANTVYYWAENSKVQKRAMGTVVTYKYYNYTSAFIHHCTIKDLEYDTKYYYRLGFGDAKRQFWFVTPPKPGPDVPYVFGLIGDIGQTYDSNTTLTHYEQNSAKGQAVLFMGDLSYADRWPNHDNNRWDTWGRFSERSVAYQPWIWTAGNHEIDYAPDIGEYQPFVPFTNRYPTPHEASGSGDPLWYAIKRASAHIIVLSSYSGFVKYSPQYKWFTSELEKVNRSETPWLIVLVHAPLYNSYEAHYMEGEAMRAIFEPYFVYYKVDIVFSGHVHSYERSERVSNVAYNIVNAKCTPVSDESAPVYITIGDGGNSEGLASEMTQPQPSYSAFREASFGHGIFDIKNRTHAHFSWHRNQDGASVEADSLWLLNRYWASEDASSVSAM